MFDSGFGGLTVARALIDLMPNEDLVYIGDTGRYPYGNKPAAEVQRFAHEIATSLVNDFDVKIIVVACNTAASVALEQLKETLPVPVVSVIEPGVSALVQTTRNKRVGVIGTVGTIDSGAYDRAIRGADSTVELISAACPGLVEFVERGQTSGPEVKLLTERLLAPISHANVDSLLLGCTHYPYLARVISDVMGPGVVLVSSGDETAFAVSKLLTAMKMTEARDHVGEHRFFSSGDPEWFASLGRRLFGPELSDAQSWVVK